jgi:hypothetical protein
MTGCIPLLLHSLIQFKKNEFDEAAFLDCRELQTAKRNILAFYNNIFQGESQTGCQQ